MIDKENKFDKAVRDKISNFIEQPPEEVWQKIEQKRKKRLITWIDFSHRYLFIFLILIFIFFGGTSYYLWNSKILGNKFSKPENQIKTVVTNDNIKIKPTQKSSKSDKDYRDQVKNQQNNLPVVMNPLPVSGEIKVNNNHKRDDGNKITRIFSKKEKAIGEKIKQSLKNNEIKLIRRYDKKIKNDLTITNYNPKEVINQSNKTGENSFNSYTNKLLNHENDSGSYNSLKDTDAIYHDLFSGADTTIHVTEINKKDSLKVTGTEAAVKIKRKKFAIEITGSPDFISKKSKLEDEHYQVYYDKRKETESIKNASSLSLKFSFYIFRKLTVGVGLQYFVINERFNYEFYSWKLSARLDSIHATIQHPFGPPEPVTYYGSITDTVLMKKTINSKNKYEFFSLPVTIQYTVQKGKFDFLLSAGTGISVSFRTKGKILSPDLNVTDLGDQSGNPFKRSAGLSLLLGLGIEYRVFGNFNVIIHPEYQYMMQSITRSSYPIKQSYNTFSIRTGLKYKF